MSVFCCTMCCSVRLNKRSIKANSVSSFFLHQTTLFNSNLYYVAISACKPFAQDPYVGSSPCHGLQHPWKQRGSHGGLAVDERGQDDNAHSQVFIAKFFHTLSTFNTSVKEVIGYCEVMIMSSYFDSIRLDMFIIN